MIGNIEAMDERNFRPWFFIYLTKGIKWFNIIASKREWQGGKRKFNHCSSYERI